MIEFHVIGMDGLQEAFEVIQRTEFGIETVVIRNSVWTPECSFAVLDADRMDRHQPEVVILSCFNSGTLLQTGKRPFLRE
jgi:hypothetical protein